MEGLGGVVFLLVMGAVWVLGQILEHVGKRRQPVQNPAPTPDEEQAQTDAVEAARTVVHPHRTRPRSASRAERRVDLRRADLAQETRIAARRLVTGRDNLRRAVIVMTVLGPPVSQRPSAATPLQRG